MEWCLLSHPSIHFCFISLHRLFHKQHLAVALFTEMLLRQICHFSRAQYELLCPCRYYEMPTANVLTASFKPHAIDYIQIQIGIFPPFSTPVHIKQKRPLRKDVSAHSNDLPSKLLAHATKQTLYSSAAWEATHKQRQCCTCEFTSEPSRWCQCKQSCWGPFTRFYVNLHLLNSMSQSGCPFVACHRSSQFLLRMPELSRANITIHSASHGWS